MASIKTKFKTSFGVARYPKISEPDTVGKYADGKYKVKLVYKIGDLGAKAFMELCDSFLKQVHGSKRNMYLPYVVDEEAGEIIVTAKTQYAPSIFDSQGRPMKGKKIGGGSVVRLAGALVEFEKGISAQFNQVQVKELNGFGECAFEAVDDGYTMDEAETDSFENADTEEDASPTSGPRNDALDI